MDISPIVKESLERDFRYAKENIARKLKENVEILNECINGLKADKKEEIVWEEYSMDDVIDLVCEWNYEFILDIDAERHNARDIIDFGNMQSRYDNLKSEEEVLDKLFDQTKYGKQVEELAVKLADELITNLSQGKDISDTVQNITTGFPKQEVSARAR